MAEIAASSCSNCLRPDLWKQYALYSCVEKMVNLSSSPSSESSNLSLWIFSTDPRNRKIRKLGLLHNHPIFQVQSSNVHPTTNLQRNHPLTESSKGFQLSRCVDLLRDCSITSSQGVIAKLTLGAWKSKHVCYTIMIPMFIYVYIACVFTVL